MLLVIHALYEPEALSQHLAHYEAHKAFLAASPSSCPARSWTMTGRR
jgi:uncharacterized protein YciI